MDRYVFRRAEERVLTEGIPKNPRSPTIPTIVPRYPRNRRLHLFLIIFSLIHPESPLAALPLLLLPVVRVVLLS